MELAPCTACRRHVATDAPACPFCAAALPPRRAPLFSVRGRVTRAAIFSAALAACSESRPVAPAPQSGSAGSGSAAGDDLEKLLDTDERTVERPAPPDAAAIATALDAGAPAPDAGVDPQAVAEREREERRRRRKAEEKRRLDEERRRIEQERLRHRDWHQHAKPYGAPPARRRVV